MLARLRSSAPMPRIPARADSPVADDARPEPSVPISTADTPSSKEEGGSEATLKKKKKKPKKQSSVRKSPPGEDGVLDPEGARGDEGDGREAGLLRDSSRVVDAGSVPPSTSPKPKKKAKIVKRSAEVGASREASATEGRGTPSSSNPVPITEQPTTESEVPPVPVDDPPVPVDDPPAVFLSSDTSGGSREESRDAEIDIDGDEEEVSHVTKSTRTEAPVTEVRAVDGLHQGDDREDGGVASLDPLEPKIVEAPGPQEQTERVGESPKDSGAV
ncbi:hypothetical protein Bca52824_009555 [Brassica carinata]|uniref:Uncharacterized protein n=1 Tax=Brassica carinata TaxID=52824 RepID=A0A8X8B9V7_BRACI|nr:hypothetical protein Bca52824_009555 [Brassica carinata]